MQDYHKFSIVMKYLKFILVLLLLVYCLYLSTNTMFCLFDRLLCSNNDVSLANLINLKKFVFDTYIITFVMMLFVVIYFGRKNKLNCNSIIKAFIKMIIFLPISALLNYNFLILGSLMSSFYLVMAVVVIIISIDFLSKKIDRLYYVAINGKKVVDKNGKGDNKKCKKK